MRSGEENGMQHELRRVQEAIRQMPRLEPDPAFGESLRRTFVSGSFGSERTVPHRLARPSWLAMFRWLAIPAAATAVLLLGHLFNLGPTWTLRGTYGKGPILIAGQSIDASSVSALKERIRPGARIGTVSEAGLELFCDGLLIVDITPGSDVTLPDRPGRLWDRTMEAGVSTGEVRVRTGPDFPGYALQVNTPEGKIELTGTLVSIFRNADLTCVCVLEGTALVGRDDTKMESVPEGMRKVMFADGSSSQISPFEPGHVEGLRKFRERTLDLFSE